MKVNDVLYFFIGLGHVGPMRMTSDAYEVEPLLSIVERIFERAVSVRDTTVIMEVTKKRLVRFKTIHALASTVGSVDVAVWSLKNVHMITKATAAMLAIAYQYSR